jgi:hypothetical protein
VSENPELDRKMREDAFKLRAGMRKAGDDLEAFHEGLQRDYAEALRGPSRWRWLRHPFRSWRDRKGVS